MNSLQVLVPLIAALVPLIITPGLLFHFDITPKVGLLLLGVAALLAPWRILNDSVTTLWNTSLGRLYIICLGLQLASFGISTWLSVDPFLSLDGSEWRRLGLYTFAAVSLFAVLAVGSLRTAGSLQRLLWACSISTIPVAAYGIAQYFGLDPLLPAAAYHAGEGPYTIVRPPGTLGHADYLASFLVFAVFVSFTLLGYLDGKSIFPLPPVHSEPWPFSSPEHAADSRASAQASWLTGFAAAEDLVDVTCTLA